MKSSRFFASPFGKLAIVSISFAVFALIFVYPLYSLLSKAGYFSDTQISDSEFSLRNFIFILMVAAPLAGRGIYQLLHNSVSRHIMAITMTWGGFCFFIFFPALLLDVIAIMFQLDANTLAILSKAILTLSALICLYGIINANRLTIKEVNLSSHKLTQQHRIVQLSDVHIGSRSAFFIGKMVRKVNSLNVDKIFITGDLVDLSSVGESDLKVLADFNAPVYFVTGNHDRYVSLKRLLPILEKQGFHILRNQNISLDGFDLIGIDDADHPRQVENIIQDIPIDKNRYTILLYHRPQGFDAAAEKGVDLMLSGHTHNGQIVPFNFFVKQVFKDIQGTIQRNGAHLHVSTGTSTWGPILRIGSNNEITLLRLKPA